MRTQAQPHSVSLRGGDKAVDSPRHAEVPEGLDDADAVRRGTAEGSKYLWDHSAAADVEAALAETGSSAFASESSSQPDVLWLETQP